MKKRTMKLLVCLTVLVLAGTVFAVPAFAAGDVASAIEQTWKAAQTQIKNVVNNVVFPVVDMILAILFFVKLGHILIIGVMGNSSLPRLPSCLPVCFLPSLPRYIFGRFCDV